MNKIAKCLFGVWCLAVVALPGHAQNLINNAGFETADYTSWSQFQPANTTINGFGHTGTSSAAGWWQTSGWQDVTIANPSLSYTVGGWMYDDVAGGESLTGGTFGSIRVEFKNASDVIVGTWNTGNLTGANLTDNAWNNLTAVVNPSSFGAGITKATLVWEVNNSGAGAGRGIFDDMVVQVVAVPELSGWLSLSAGLTCLAALNYRKKLKKISG